MLSSDEEVIEWATDVTQSWIRDFGREGFQSPDARDLARAVVQSNEPDFGLRCIFTPDGLSFVVYDVGVWSATTADWAADHRAMLDALSAGQRRRMIENSDDAEVQATLCLDLFDVDSAEMGFPPGAVVGQACGIARRNLRPLGQVDFAARGMGADLELLELSTGPLLSFLLGDDIVAAVQVD